MNSHSSRGLTFIETVMAIASVSLLMVVALPELADHGVRSKVAQSVEQARNAQFTLAQFCAENSNELLRSRTSENFVFQPSKHVKDIVGYADCERGTMAVGLTTQETGVANSPVVGLFGLIDHTNGAIHWECRTLLGETAHVPSNCREVGIPPEFAPITHQSG